MLFLVSGLLISRKVESSGGSPAKSHWDDLGPGGKPFLL